MKLTHANKDAIKYACLHFHYAKRLPASSIAYNVYNDNNEWCGVIIYGRGANPNAGVKYKLCNGEYMELVRVALNGKQECTSKAVAISLRLLKKENPILKLVISYADIDQNHYGTIYQATNWVYCGESKTGGIRAYLINGKEVHTKTAKDKVYKYFKEFSIENLKKVYNTNNISEVGTKGKRLYLMPLNKEMAKEIEKYRKPYPKKNEDLGVAELKGKC